MRIIATITNPLLGLVRENEVLNASELTIQTMLDEKMAEIYDDTEPLVGKSIQEYEPGMVYPEKRQVWHDGCSMISKVETSDTFIKAQWRPLLIGLTTTIFTVEDMQ